VIDRKGRGTWHFGKSQISRNRPVVRGGLDPVGGLCEEIVESEKHLKLLGERRMQSFSEQVLAIPQIDRVAVGSRSMDWWIVSIAMLVALVSARPYAGSWNDGGRLASVEAMVDYHTLSIDQSVFVDVDRITGAALPYPADNENLLEHGTRDKLLIHGHYYSDKPMVQSLAMAGVYALLQKTTGLMARDRPDFFAYLMTLTSSGLAFVFSVWGIGRIGRQVGLSENDSFLLAMSFSFATAALPYTCHVNQHVVLLAIAVAVLIDAHVLSEPSNRERSDFLRMARMGLCAGFGYGIDFGAGAPLALLTGLFILWQRPAWKSVVVVSLAMLPGVLLYHGVNFAIGGSWMPANANAEFLRYPGSPFSAENATGGWKHESLRKLFLYGADLLWGKRGFFEHSAPLLLVVFAGYKLVWSAPVRRSMLLFCLAWCGLTWLTYASGSNNLSGACYSIRWFVPLLAPGYYMLAVLLRTSSRVKPHFVLLSAWGILIAGLGWWEGPWSVRMVPMYWFIVAAMVISWAYLTWRLHRPSNERIALPLEFPGTETSVSDRPLIG